LKRSNRDLPFPCFILPVFCLRTCLAAFPLLPYHARLAGDFGCSHSGAHPGFPLGSFFRFSPASLSPRTVPPADMLSLSRVNPCCLAHSVLCSSPPEVLLLFLWICSLEPPKRTLGPMTHRNLLLHSHSDLISSAAHRMEVQNPFESFVVGTFFLRFSPFGSFIPQALDQGPAPSETSFGHLPLPRVRQRSGITLSFSFSCTQTTFL